ncbi:DUF4347 domain-containing protein, partial [Algoriphagus zhangzhouensis]
MERSPISLLLWLWFFGITGILVSNDNSFDYRFGARAVTSKVYFRRVDANPFLISNSHSSAQVENSKVFTFGHDEISFKSDLLWIDEEVEGKDQILSEFEISNEFESTLQFFSHGKPGQLKIGGQWLSPVEISNFLSQLISSKQGEIDHVNIYGCEFGRGIEGRGAVSYLEATLGISVSASDDITGRDGDWELEVGKIENASFLKDYEYNLQSCAGVIGGTGSGDDYDGDGICNSDDLDDDNDGILDADECGSLFTNEFTGTFGENSSWFTRDLETAPGGGYSFLSSLTSSSPNGNTLNEGKYIVMNGHVDNAHTYFASLVGHTTGTQDDMFLAVNGSINVGVFFSSTFYLSSNTPYDFGFWAANANSTSNGAINFPVNLGYRLIRISDGIVVASGSTDNITTSHTWTNSSGTYLTGATTEQYRFEVYNLSTGAAGNDFAIDDIYFTGCGDNDGDGIKDYLDLDSDNDGCPDALESESSPYVFADLNSDGSINTTSYPVNTNSSSSTYGVPGSQSYLEGTATNNNLVSAECDSCNPASSLFTDVDGDGVGDACDLDNDNDGILDTNENYVCGITDQSDFIGLSSSGSIQSQSISQDGFSSGNETLSLINGTGDGTLAAETAPSFAHRDIALGGDGNGIKIGGNINSSETKVVSFDYDNPVRKLSFRVADVDFGNGAGPERLTINAYLSDGTLLDLSSASFKETVFDASASTSIISTSITPSNTIIGNTLQGDGNAHHILEVTFLMPAGSLGINKIDFIAFGAQPTDNQMSMTLFDLNYCGGEDTDGDGIPDYLDTDSDNDGCPDALEGDGGFTYADLVGNSLGVDVDVDGVPNSVSGGQNDVSAYNDEVQSEACSICHPDHPNFTDTDGDGYADFCDDDDDNDGILDTEECSTLTEVYSVYIHYRSGNNLSSSVPITITGSTVVNTTIDQTTPTSSDLVFTDNTDSEEFELLAANISPNASGEIVIELNTNGATSSPYIVADAVLLYDGNTYYNLIDNQEIGFSSTAGWLFQSNQDASVYWDNMYIANDSPTDETVSWTFSGLPMFTCDEDGDGVPNHLDWDSDNDGCPDALEGNGGFTYADLEGYVLEKGTDVDTNGVPSIANGGQANISAYDDSVQSEACSPCDPDNPKYDPTDSDGDGYVDSCDEDDDNDGIIDTEEGFCVDESTYTFDIAASLAAQNTIGINGGILELVYLHTSGPQIPDIGGAGVNDRFTIEVELSDLNSNFGVDHQWDGTMQLMFGNTYAVSPNESLFYSGLPASNVRDFGIFPSEPPYPLSILSSDQFFVNAIRENLLEVLGTFTVSIGDYPSVPSNYKVVDDLFETYNSYNETFPWSSTSLSGRSGYWAKYQDQNEVYSDGSDISRSPYFYANYGKTYNIDYSAYSLVSGSGIGDSGGRGLFSVYNAYITFCVSRDTDNDGTPDYLDTDSDDDGCPDALEGDGGFTFADLVGNSLGVDVDVDGVPNSVSGGQNDVSAYNEDLQSEACSVCHPDHPSFIDSDGDGVGDACDLDNDNDGILDTDEGCINTEFAGDNSNQTGSPYVATLAYPFNIHSTPLKSVPSNLRGFVVSPTTIPDMIIGAGVDTTYVPATNGSVETGAYSVTQIDASTLEEARLNDEYLEFSFTTLNSVFDAYIDWYGIYNPVATNPDYSVAFSVSNDGFASDLTDLGTISQVAGEGGGVYPMGRRNRRNDPYYLSPNTTYTVRIYLFGVDDASSVVQFDDPILAFDACVSDTDGDGVLNNLDTDSDNDGCPDAVEYYSDINATGSNGSDDYGDGSVDSDGKVIAASYSGDYTNAILATQISVTSLTSDQIAEAGSNVSFSVEALAINTDAFINDGDPDFSIPPGEDVTSGIIYQWQLSEDGGSTWTNISDGGQYSGTTTSQLTVSNVTSSQSGDLFKVVLTHQNLVCPVESTPSLLEVGSLILTKSLTNADDAVVDTEGETIEYTITVEN